jgi:hypothetical protein
MEGQVAAAPQATAEQDNSWVVILLSAIGVYLLFKKPKPKSSASSDESSRLDSFSKFLNTPLGQSIDDQMAQEGIELSGSQIMMLDRCLQGLTNEQYRILEKASGFSKKEDLFKALSAEEIKVFKPLRKRIMDCVDETINK